MDIELIQISENKHQVYFVLENGIKVDLGLVRTNNLLRIAFDFINIAAKIIKYLGV